MCIGVQAKKWRVNIMGTLIGVGGSGSSAVSTKYISNLIKSGKTSVYGYRQYITSKSRLVTRIGNLDLHKTLPLQSQIRRYLEAPDGTFICWLDGLNSRFRADNGVEVALDGSVGNVMVYKPGYWFKVETGSDGNGAYVDRLFSLIELPGYIYRKPLGGSAFWGTFDNVNNRVASVCSLTFNADGSIARDVVTDLPVFAANAAQFRGGTNSNTWDNTYRSMLGTARTTVTRADIIAKGFGTLTGAAGQFFTELAQLYTLEYANYNGQETYNAALTVEGYRQGGLGSGPTVSSSEWNTHNGYNSFIPNGVTVGLGNRTGRVDYRIKNWANTGVDKTVAVSSYRGVELWFEYLWRIVPDHIIYHAAVAAGNKCSLYVTEDHTKLANPASDETNGLTLTPPAGYELRSVNISPAEGYGWVEVANKKGDMYPQSVSASATEGLCDYFYRSADRGWFGPLLAGYAASGSLAGVRYAYTTSRCSYAHANFGFSLCRHNPAVE